MSASGPSAVPSMSRRGRRRARDLSLDAAPGDVADLRPRAADVERRAIDDDLARDRRQRRPRLARGCGRGAGRKDACRRGADRCDQVDAPPAPSTDRHRVARCVGERHAFDLGRDAEVAVAGDPGVVETEVPQVAADPDRRARDRPFANRAGEVAANALRQAERQVARGPRRDAVDQLAVELEQARIAPAAADAAAGPERQVAGQVAPGVGIGEARRRRP
jgi:hypothetical protein